MCGFRAALRRRTSRKRPCERGRRLSVEGAAVAERAGQGVALFVLQRGLRVGVYVGVRERLRARLGVHLQHEHHVDMELEAIARRNEERARASRASRASMASGVSGVSAASKSSNEMNEPNESNEHPLNEPNESNESNESNEPNEHPLNESNNHPLNESNDLNSPSSPNGSKSSSESPSKTPNDSKSSSPSSPSKSPNPSNPSKASVASDAMEKDSAGSLAVQFRRSIRSEKWRADSQSMSVKPTPERSESREELNCSYGTADFRHNPKKRSGNCGAGRGNRVRY